MNTIRKQHIKEEKKVRIIDFNSLWELFVSSNFIYKAKFKALEDVFPFIKVTWTNLLNANEDVCYNNLKFKDGQISNSLSVTRYYHNSWLVQHMVSNSNPKGMIEVLQGAMNWLINNPEANFTKFYWRPQNRVPELMFNGMKRYLNQSGQTTKLRIDNR